MRLQETFRPIYAYRPFGDPVFVFYDVDHFEARMRQRAFGELGLTKDQVMKVFEKGAEALDKDYSFLPGQFMIVSLSTRVKLPVTVTKDRYSDRMIGLVPTLLELNHPHYDKQRPEYTDVFVESYRRLVILPAFEESKDFVEYLENGKITSSYEVIQV